MKIFLLNTLLCDCKKTFKTIKVLLLIFDDEGNCSLTEQEKMEDQWRFFCCDCEKFNCIDFSNFVNKTTVMFLKRKVILSSRLLSIAKEIDKINNEIKETLFLLEKNKLETDLITFHLSNIKL